MFRKKLLIWTVHHTFLESRPPEVTKNLYHVLSTRHNQTPIILAPVHGRYWGGVKENIMQSLSAFYCLFGDKKVAFKSPFDLYFHPFIIEFF